MTNDASFVWEGNGCACAIFDEDGPVLLSPPWRAYFGEGYHPTIPPGSLEVYSFSSPVVHSVLRRDFSLTGKEYSLYTAVLAREGVRDRQMDLQLYQADISFAHLFSLAEKGSACTACSIMSLFDSVAELLQRHVSSAIEIRMPLYNAAVVRVSRPALMMALGLLAPDLLAEGELTLSLAQACFELLAIRLHGSCRRISPFVRSLILALGQGGGFAVDFDEDAVSFTLARCEVIEHTLYAGPREWEDEDCFLIALAMR